MDIQVSAIGGRLKEIRAGRELSLDDVSKMTGVSKPMLGQIERGRSTPSVTTLWKIATGLKMPLSSFLEEPQPEYAVVGMGSDVITEDGGRMRAYPLFPYDPIRSVEIFCIEFDAGCRHTSQRHSDGVEEYILVLSGKLQLILNGQEVIVGAKQAVRFKADVPHAYNNPFDEQCVVHNIIFYTSD